jgi:hypothetical protein
MFLEDENVPLVLSGLNCVIRYYNSPNALKEKRMETPQITARNRLANQRKILQLNRLFRIFVTNERLIQTKICPEISAHNIY